MRLNSLHSRPPLFSALLVGIALTSFACQAKDVAPATSATSDTHPVQDVYRDPSNFCRGGSFAKSKQFRLAKVVGTNATRAYFFNDDLDECPNVSLEKCKEKSYLIPGDQLAVAKTHGKFICGWYSPAKGSSTVGWLLSSDLEISPPDAVPSPDKWAGTWSAYSGSHSITIKNETTGSLRMHGEASWTGITGSVHIGNFNSSTKPQGNQVSLDDGMCKVNLTLLGDYLVANDNSYCGGANVRFNGVYKQKK